MATQNNALLTLAKLNRKPVAIPFSLFPIPCFLHEPPPENLILPTGHQPDRFAVSNMLLSQYPNCQRVCIVAIQHRNRPLQHNHPVIQPVIHKMDGAPGRLHPIFERLLLRLEPRESRKQRRMNIQYAIWKRSDKYRRKQPHVTGKANQIHAM